MKRFLLPLLFLLVFISESIFVQIVPNDMFNHHRIFVPHFLLVFLIFLTVYGSRKQGVLYGLLFGLLFDVVYTGIMGIYLCLLPIICFIISKTMKVLQSNIVITSFVSLIGIAILEFTLYGGNLLLHLTTMDFNRFVNIRLFPTLVLNLAFIIIVAFPLKVKFEKISQRLLED